MTITFNIEIVTQTKIALASSLSANHHALSVRITAK